ncbi:hypothetical protein MDAP_000221 [Mitosporidium daphniae]|uniref:Fumarylacetoacetase-like C-terminal domain-containing protein n=1 Tax=Mitosporidium daphniae TaxID=1485682 RepID=A0A098VW68_9MICR|nr:uncharacterized protein DI09_106p110 [Mitosporidium daphniae]KGG53187.1 hypothetical protein DI09_106p110 [Mitosporidium daphniae]|eukprot:XP_013239623.1 uncharacterized protein DI09_106p110 [Mitosporidium daphniae]
MRDFIRYERLQSSPVEPLRQNPFFFCLKPTSSLVQQPNPIRLPVQVESDFEHEVELGIIIGENAGRNIKAEYAMNTIAGYCLAIDLTARTLQNEAAKSGLPWSISKGFDTFCPVGVNGQLRQEVNTSKMLLKIPELIQTISSLMRLEQGDLILTAGIDRDFSRMMFRVVPGSLCREK